MEVIFPHRAKILSLHECTSPATTFTHYLVSHPFPLHKLAEPPLKALGYELETPDALERVATIPRERVNHSVKFP